MTTSPRKAFRKSPQAINRARMGPLLEFFGAIDPVEHKKRIHKRWTNGRSNPPLEHWPERKLWDLYDRAKAGHRRQSLRHHPRKAGDSDEQAKIIHAAWRRLKQLFKRRGIEP